MIKFKYSFLTGFLLALIVFIFLAMTNKMSIAIVVSSFILIISPLIFYIKLYSKIKFAEKFTKFDKSLIKYSGLSNHLINGIAVGGNLYLFNDKLIFQTNFLNFASRHEEIILLNNIEKVDIANLKFGLFSGNYLEIITKENERKHFAVNKKEIWKENIKKTLIKNSEI